MRHRGIAYRRLRRAAALAVGVLLVGLTAAPAWADPPSAPDQPAVTFGDSQITVSFTPPFDGGVSIDSYTADCESGDPGAASGNNTGPDSPITVTGLTNGDTYTCTVTATNADGTSDPSPASDPVVPAAKPAAPATPSVTAGAAQIQVSVTPPDDGGSAITLYSADCESADPGASPGAATDAGPTITVTGLTNGSAYTCTVTATNAAGTSDPSPQSDSATPVDVPEAPPQPTVVPGNKQIQVSFGAARDGGSPITTYTASCTSGTGTPGSHSNAVEPITVTGLTNGASYTCTVTATNIVGTGPESPASASAVPVAVPDPPTITSVTRGNASITVAFTPGATNGSPITSFAASCTSTNGGSAGAHSSSASPIAVTGLTNGKTYTCKVTATNAKGASPPSTASTTVVPATLPGAPTIGIVTSGNASASVSFTPGATNGSAITSFTASCTSNNGGAPGSNSGANAPITVTGLTNGSIYTCKATATNDVGTGAASSASAGLVVGEPGAPVGVKVVSGSTSSSTGPLNVSFTPGPDNGSPITSYGVSCSSTNGGAAGTKTGSTSMLVVSGLTTMKTYLCTVVATNARGTSVDSASAKGIVGTPAAPAVSAPLPLAHGVALPFATPANNGSTISGYRVRCTSGNGGVAGSSLQTVSPVVTTNLTDGKTYSCALSAINARGEGAATLATPIVAGAPNVGNLVSCSGTSGTLTTDPGFLLKFQQLQTSTLNATYSTCHGPYVSAGRIAMSFRTARPGVSCQKAINITNGGSGSFTWTSPTHMGKSAATARWLVTATSGHTTTLHYYGTVTARGNLLTDRHISGNITLDKGLHAVAFGGNCSETKPITSFNVTAISLTIS